MSTIAPVLEVKAAFVLAFLESKEITSSHGLSPRPSRITRKVAYSSTVILPPSLTPI